MSRPFEVPEHDGRFIDPFENAFAQFLMAYSAATGVNYWSLMLFAFDITHGATAHVDRIATINLLDATAKITKAQDNLPFQVDRRRTAMHAILEKGALLSSEPAGRA